MRRPFSSVKRSVAPIGNRVDQNSLETGQVAMRTVAGLIQQNERGIPRFCRRILVEGRWVEDYDGELYADGDYRGPLPGAVRPNIPPPPPIASERPRYSPMPQAYLEQYKDALFA